MKNVAKRSSRIGSDISYANWREGQTSDCDLIRLEREDALYVILRRFLRSLARYLSHLGALAQFWCYGAFEVPWRIIGEPLQFGASAVSGCSGAFLVQSRF